MEEQPNLKGHASCHNRALSGYVYESFYTKRHYWNGYEYRIQNHANFAIYGISPHDGKQIFVFDFPDWHETNVSKGNSGSNCVRVTIEDGEILFSLEDICYLVGIKRFRNMRASTPHKMNLWLDCSILRGNKRIIAPALRSVKAVTMEELNNMIQNRTGIFRNDGRANYICRHYRKTSTWLDIHDIGIDGIKPEEEWKNGFPDGRLTRAIVANWLMEELFPTIQDILQHGIRTKIREFRLESRQNCEDFVRSMKK